MQCICTSWFTRSLSDSHCASFCPNPEQVPALTVLWPREQYVWVLHPCQSSLSSLTVHHRRPPPSFYVLNLPIFSSSDFGCDTTSRHSLAAVDRDRECGQEERQVRKESSQISTPGSWRWLVASRCPTLVCEHYCRREATKQYHRQRAVPHQHEGHTGKV